MSKILVATSNKGKMVEINFFLKNLNIELADLSSYPSTPPKENGLTFEENALIKADYYSSLTRLNVLTDDSGLCIDALEGKPGIYTARWADKNDKFDKIANLIAHSRTKNYQAYFTCVLCYKELDKKAVFFEGRTDGRISFPPKGEQGLGFDSIFIAEGTNKSFAEMNKDEKLKYSARGKALKKLSSYLSKNE